MSELHILLVDDSEDDRFLAARALKRLSFPVRLDIARDGAEAIARLHGKDEEAAGPLPTLVLLDLQMPRLSGTEVLERLRATPATRELPVIIVTASEHPEDRDRCRELGACHYIAKPLEADRLQEVLAGFRKTGRS